MEFIIARSALQEMLTGISQEEMKVWELLSWIYLKVQN
jgi:hypothetical protein